MTALVPRARSLARAALALAALALVAVGCSAGAVDPAAADDAPRLDRAATGPVHRVSGGGKLDVSAFGLPPESYAFTASIDGAGNVRGEMQVRLVDPLVAFHADVTCLAVSGRDAWIGFVVVRSDDETMMPVGAQRWLRVQDNGEGGSGEPDRMSFVLPGGGAARCNERRPVALPFAWLHGDIHVR